MRLFVAVNLDAGVRELIARAIEAFPVDRPPWRWVAPQNWHVTLKFLGEMPESDIAGLARCLEQVAVGHTAFPLSIRAFGGFPNLKRPRVLFYHIDEGADPLRELAGDVDEVLWDTMGIPKEENAFRAHVTVARVKSRLPRPVVDKLKLAPPLVGAGQRVVSFELMKSELRREGARYERLKEFALPQAP